MNKRHASALFALTALLAAAPARPAEELDKTFKEVPAAAAEWRQVKFKDVDGSAVEAWCHAPECDPAKAENHKKPFALFQLTPNTNKVQQDLSPNSDVLGSLQLHYSGITDLEEDKDTKAKKPVTRILRDGYARRPVATIAAAGAPRPAGSQKTVRVLKPAAWVTVADSPMKLLGAEPHNCTATTFKKGFYEYESNLTEPPKKESQQKGHRGVFAWWLPVEIELLRGIQRADDYTELDPTFNADEFRKTGEGTLRAKMTFAETQAASADAPYSGLAKSFAQDEVRPRFGKAASYLAAQPDKGPSKNFSTFEAPFLRCRLGYVGKQAEFNSKLLAAESSEPELQKFVTYWRAFVRSEMSQYIDDQKSLDKSKKVDYDGLLTKFAERTNNALTDYDHPNAQRRAAMFARTQLKDPNPPPTPEQEFAKGLPKDPQPDQLSQHEYERLNNEEQKEYIKNLVTTAPTPPSTAPTAARLAMLADIRKKIDAAAAKDSETRLSPAELAVFGDQMKAVQAVIDGAKDDAEKKKKVSQARQILQVFQKKNPAAGSRIAKEQLDRAQKTLESGGDLAALERAFDGGTGALETRDVDKGGKKPDLKNDGDKGKGFHTSDVPKADDKVVASSDDDDKSWKKEAPALTEGVKFGLWAAILGFFLAGPAGVAIFAVAGGLLGYSMSKINKALDD